MPDLLCRCDGEGWYWDDARNVRVFCSCPAGWRKKEYLEKSRDERRREWEQRKGRKKEPRERVPF